jgi:hypothetical protein
MTSAGPSDGASTTVLIAIQDLGAQTQVMPK